MSVLTPNMNLIQPVIGVDSGLNWEQSANANAQSVDLHDHTPGRGVPLSSNSLSITSSLDLQGQSEINVQGIVFVQQASYTNLNAIYFGIDGNLYVNDGSGNPTIQMTAGGTVNATSSGISSGTATASFQSGVLVVNANTNLPANIQGGSILLGNNTVGSNFLTLAPPSAMPGSYSLTLPSLPAAQNIVTLDNAGNFGAVWNVDGATIVVASNLLTVGTIQTANIANSSVTTVKIAAAAVTIPKLGFVVETKVDTFTSSGTWVAPTGVTEIVVWGCGGGGAGGSAGGGAGGTNGGGGGGGAGATLVSSRYTVVPGNSYNVIIGTGGVRAATTLAAADGLKGGDGVASSVADPALAFTPNVLIFGGGGGGGGGLGTAQTGGAGGSVANYPYATNGGAGATGSGSAAGSNGFASIYNSGGLGGVVTTGVGTGGGGGGGGFVAASLGGTGAVTPASGGNGNDATSTNTNYGSGGGGGSGGRGAATTGGRGQPGGPGIIFVTYPAFV